MIPRCELILVIILEISQCFTELKKSIHFDGTFQKSMLFAFLHFPHKLFERQTMNSLSSIICYSFLDSLCEKCFPKLAGIKWPS